MIDLEYDIMETEWNVYGPPITSDFPWSWDYVKFIAIHWPGGNRFWTNGPNYMQASHRGFLNKGYSFGYSAAVHLDTGETMQGRGLRFRAASNGDKENGDDDEPDNPGLNDNMEVYSITVNQGMNEHITPQAINGVKRIIAQLLAIKPTLQVVPHGYLDATGCPGPELTHLIRQGEFTLSESEIMAKANVILIRFHEAEDQFICIPLSGDTKGRAGLKGVAPITVVPDASFAQLQDAAGYPLTRIR